MVFVFIQLVEGTIVHYYYLKGKHLIRLRRKNIKRSLKVFEQNPDRSTGNKLASVVNTTSLMQKSVGKWRKDREPVTYEPPTADLVSCSDCFWFCSGIRTASTRFLFSFELQFRSDWLKKKLLALDLEDII